MSVDACVIIRGAGERTSELCRHLVAAQVGGDGVTVVHERPFVEAVRRTFRIGVDSGRTWTLAIDADVLLRSDAISTFLQLGVRAPSETFVAMATVLDKVFGGPRPAGQHLYRTSLLETALGQMDGADDELRPENFVISNMERLGWPWVRIDEVVGLHDYEQYYRDLYRKAFVHAHKHRNQMQHFSPYFRRQRRHDPDFQALCWGIEDGLRFDGQVRIDVGDFPDVLTERLARHGLEEKGPLGLDAIGPEAIGRMIDEHVPPRAYLRWQKDRSCTPWRRKMWKRIKARSPHFVRASYKRLRGSAAPAGQH